MPKSNPHRRPKAKHRLQRRMRKAASTPRIPSRFERVLAFGPVVNYNNRETWTSEVQRLYQSLSDGDFGALAPLVSIDLEFISDPKALYALVILKYDPDYPAPKARAELRKIASVIQQRPGRRRAKLPPGDLLLAEMRGLASWIERHELLRLKKDPKALRRRIKEILDPTKRPAPEEPKIKFLEVGWINDDGTLHPSPEPEESWPRLSPKQLEAFSTALVNSSRTSAGYVKTPLSWAKGAIAENRDVTRKVLDKRIARDPIAQAWRAQDRPHRPAKPTDE